jgi:hypothetical protein
MASEHDVWLRQLVADRAGGFGLQGAPRLHSIVRGKPYTLPFAVEYDVSGDAFAASLRQIPDAAGVTLADFDIAVSAYESGATTVTLSLTATQTGNLPPDGDFDGVLDLVFDLIRTPAGGDPNRFLGGIIPVSGKVT